MKEIVKVRKIMWECGGGIGLGLDWYVSCLGRLSILVFSMIRISFFDRDCMSHDRASIYFIATR